MKPMILGREYIDTTGAVDNEEVLRQLGQVMASLGYPAPYRGADADENAHLFRPFYVYDDNGTNRFFSPPVAGQDPTDLLDAYPGGLVTGSSGYTEYIFGTGGGGTTGVAISYPLLVRGVVISITGNTCTISPTVMSEIPVLAPTGSSEPALADPLTVAFTYGSAGSGATQPFVSVGDLIYATRADQGVDGGVIWQMVDSSMLQGALEVLDSYQVHAVGNPRYLLANGTSKTTDDPEWSSITSVLKTADGWDPSVDQYLIHLAGEDPKWLEAEDLKGEPGEPGPPGPEGPQGEPGEPCVECSEENIYNYVLQILVGLGCSCGGGIPPGGGDDDDDGYPNDEDPPTGTALSFPSFITDIFSIELYYDPVIADTIVVQINFGRTQGPFKLRQANSGAQVVVEGIPKVGSLTGVPC